MKRQIMEHLDTSNLEENKWYTYKELCQALNEGTKSSTNSRKTQLEEFSRFFKWTYNKGTKKYKVVKIYEECKDEIYKYSSKMIYTKYIECLLLGELMQEKGCDITYPLKPFYKSIGVLGTNFENYSNNRKALLDNLQYSSEYQNECIEINEYDINYIYKQCYEKLRDILESALNSLQRRKQIKWEKVDEILYYDKLTGMQCVKTADPEERSIILKVEHDALKEIHCKEESDVYRLGKEKEYYRICNSLLEEYGDLENIKLVKYWSSYHIVYNKDILPAALNDTQIELNKMCLNGELINFLHDKTNKNIDFKYLQKRADDCVLDLYLQDNDVNEVIGNQVSALKEMHKKLYSMLLQLSPDVMDVLNKEKRNKARREKYAKDKEKKLT